MSLNGGQTLLGADPDELERCASRLLRAAQRFDRMPRLLSAQIHSAAWVGPAANRFGAEWNRLHEPALRRAAAHLRLSAEQLQTQSKQQRLASASEVFQAMSHTSHRKMDAIALHGIYRSQQVAIATELQVLRAHRDAWLQMSVVGGLLSGIRFLPFDPLESIDTKILWLQSLDGEHRQFLFLDTHRSGHAAEVFGDLDQAKHVAVVVPGVSSDLGDFARPRRLAASVLQVGAADTAVIQWLGYNPPQNLFGAALNGGESSRRAAQEGAEQLQSFVADLQHVGATDITVIGHSLGAYLASVAAATGPGLNANRLVFAGSPGSFSAHVEELQLSGGPGSASTVFFVEQGQDPISAGVFGNSVLGTDVADPGFGATQLLDGQQGVGNPLSNHSSYFRDPVTLQSLRSVIQGRAVSQ
ncbi:MAG: alpha/beta hydrolase [Microthrixaceae bacterium]